MNDDFKTNVRRWAFERMIYAKPLTLLQRRDAIGTDGREQKYDDQQCDVPVVAGEGVDGREGEDYKGRSGVFIPAKFSFLK